MFYVSSLSAALAAQLTEAAIVMPPGPVFRGPWLGRVSKVHSIFATVTLRGCWLCVYVCVCIRVRLPGILLGSLPTTMEGLNYYSSPTATSFGDKILDCHVVVGYRAPWSVPLSRRPSFSTRHHKHNRRLSFYGGSVVPLVLANSSPRVLVLRRFQQHGATLGYAHPFRLVPNIHYSRYRFHRLFLSLPHMETSVPNSENMLPRTFAC